MSFVIADLTITGAGTTAFFTPGVTSGVSSYNDNGTWRAFKSMFYKVNGQWTTIQSGWYNDKGTWRKFFGSTGIGPTALAVTVSPFGASHTFTTDVAGSSSTNFVATATGGTPPYTYLWNRQPVPPPGLAFLGTTTNTLTLSGFWNANTAAHYVENWDVLVTDSLGNMASSSLFQDILILNAPAMSVVSSQGQIGTFMAFPGSNIFTRSILATVTGGSSPYTYAWSFLSNVVDPTFMTPFFISSTTIPNPRVGLIYIATGGNLAEVDSADCILNVRVTDSQGNSATAQESVSFIIDDTTGANTGGGG